MACNLIPYVQMRLTSQDVISVIRIYYVVKLETLEISVLQIGFLIYEVDIQMITSTCSILRHIHLLSLKTVLRFQQIPEALNKVWNNAPIVSKCGRETTHQRLKSIELLVKLLLFISSPFKLLKMRGFSSF